ncbi:Alpha/Beta hydrolase protein [Tribonema minus]|uniref:Alpha/Beta hydrolase protein n=1 Tax=Tribonema minus TaxID=303371 RepID=A0A835YYX8_9STRA|nr:Alpha/Beta hydrolase protein [Tribonema minus]
MDLSRSAPSSPSGGAGHKSRSGVPDVRLSPGARDDAALGASAALSPAQGAGSGDAGSGTRQRCCKCARPAAVWCGDCAAHLCDSHDRSRHKASLFRTQRLIHSRTRHTHDFDIGVFEIPPCPDVPLSPGANSRSELSPTASSKSPSPRGAERGGGGAAPTEEDAGAAGSSGGGARSGGGGAASKAARKRAQKQGAIKQLRTGYNALVMAIVRPPRCCYAERDLGPWALSVGGGLVLHRRDFPVVNRRGVALACSQWRPSFVDATGALPCVVYLHGNSSARVDVVRTRALTALASMGASIVAFDFSGSGLSGGDFVTLGGNEQHDVADVLAYLRSECMASRFTIWGRSMGAASALLYTSKYGSEHVAGLVLDSPFASFRALCQDLVAMGQVRVPKVAVRAALALIRRSVKKRTHTDISKLNPHKGCARITCPALFIAARGDRMVPPHHGAQLAEAYAGPKYLINCSGKHNSTRPAAVQDAIALFIRASFRWPQQPMEPVLATIAKRVADADPGQRVADAHPGEQHDGSAAASAAAAAAPPPPTHAAAAALARTSDPTGTAAATAAARERMHSNSRRPAAARVTARSSASVRRAAQSQLAQTTPALRSPGLAAAAAAPAANAPQPSPVPADGAPHVSGGAGGGRAAAAAGGGAGRPQAPPPAGLSPRIAPALLPPALLLPAALSPANIALVVAASKGGAELQQQQHRRGSSSGGEARLAPMEAAPPSAQQQQQQRRRHEHLAEAEEMEAETGGDLGAPTSPPAQGHSGALLLPPPAAREALKEECSLRSTSVVAVAAGAGM